MSGEHKRVGVMGPIKQFAALLLLMFSMVGVGITKEIPLKIGIVDSHQLLERYSGYIDVIAMLDKEFLDKDKVLIERRNNIDQVRTQLLQAGDDIDQLRTLEREILNLEREFARLSDEFRQEYNLRKNEELYKMQRRINDAILTYADQNGYDLILESGLVYSKEELNLTDRIFNLLTEEFDEQ